MTEPFADTASTRTNRSARTIAVDNLLRKTLRVADPHDPEQIARALLARYPQEAERDRRERAGLSYSDLVGATRMTPEAAGPASYELKTARDDLDRDIQTLTTASALKTIQVELVGWGRAVRGAAAEGLAAARLALDPNSHDMAMSARRTLSQYARLARFTGALSEGSTVTFRRFAQSCDVISALILVAIGDGLAASGITRSTMLVRVAASELQSRRGAVINALRALTGSLDSPLGQSDYPRGIVGYQMLVRQLENGGQSDLRGLLDEHNLSEAMDKLVDLTGGASIENLRELSSTATVLLDRFQRLIQYGASVPVPGGYAARGTLPGSPESPPLLSFVAALQLFVDAFSRNGSSRLLNLARPPILAYGLYGVSDDHSTGRLIQLSIARGRLADAIDCFAACGCEPDEVAATVLLDLVLTQLDRAIDLWAVGTDANGRGDPERRALASGILAYNAIAAIENGFAGGRWLVDSLPQAILDALRQAHGALATGFASDPVGGFVEQGDLLGPDAARSIFAVSAEMRIAFASEFQTERLVRTLADGCGAPALFNRGFRDANDIVYSSSLVPEFLRSSFAQISPNERIDPDAVVTLPQTLDAAMSGLSAGDATYFHPDH